MNLTNIKIRQTFDDDKLKAVLSVVIDDCFAVHDIKVIQGIDRLFVAMPSRKDDKGAYRDVVHPMCSDVRIRFEQDILDAYNKYIAVKDIMEK